MLILKKAGITPIVVFDGKRPIAKMANDQRINERLKLLDEYNEAVRLQQADEAASLLRRLIVPTTSMFACLAQALTENDITHMTAPFEAEKQIARNVCEVHDDFIFKKGIFN